MTTKTQRRQKAEDVLRQLAGDVVEIPVGASEAFLRAVAGEVLRVHAHQKVFDQIAILRDQHCRDNAAWDCGLHSGIPVCCIRWSAHTERHESMEALALARWSARRPSRAWFIPCPNHRKARPSVRLRVCPQQPALRTWCDENDPFIELARATLATTYARPIRGPRDPLWLRDD